MTATPALTPDIFGRYQKKISDAFYLDHKESEYVLTELQKFALEYVSGIDMSRSIPFDHTLAREIREAVITDSDPGDEHAG